MKKYFWPILIFILFFLGRFYILKNPPPFYSDVSHDYYRYAQMWSQGLTPYLKHFYEYPPATIPLLYLPLQIQFKNFGFYYLNYRLIIFIFDLVLFTFIYRYLTKLKISKISKVLSFGFYLVTPLIAKDFFYEGIDLVFIGSLVLAIIFFSRRLLFWILFWLSTAIKFLTAPLATPFLLLKKSSLVTEIKTAAIGFFLVWGLPLLIYRSSLAVMFVFHNQRALKYASFPSFIVETINYFTQTETRINLPPDFQLSGPVSAIAEKVTAIVFPISILLVLGYSAWQILKHKVNPQVFSLKLSLIYIFTLFLTGKVFSQPFHIWYLPLIALFPFKSIKQQLSFMIPALWLLVIDTTPWIKLDEGLMVVSPIPLKFFIYLSRFLPMFLLLFLSFKLPNQNENKIN